VTYHPVTLEYEQASWQIHELLAALDELGLPVVFTLPNADTGGQTIITALQTYVESHANARMVDNLGTQAYFSMMRIASAMVGNSSSGILEAASFHLPVVNIGNRQRGRMHAENVLDVAYEQTAIVAGIRAAVDPAFRAALAALVNPYGDGHAAERIVERLETIPLDERLVTKHFYDLPSEQIASPG
jgi:UDP-hydrolysing UDP-N-acetyl-D-glucosamine 2-epimerase